MPVLETDPIDFALTTGADGGDIEIPIRFSSGLDGVVQAVRIRLALFRGEWFLNLDSGIPYLARDGVDESEALLGEVFDERRALTVFRAAILDTPGVVAVNDLTAVFDSATREMTITWSAKTVFGDTPLDTLTPPAGST